MALDFGLASYDPRKATASDFSLGTSYPVYDDAIMRRARNAGQITYNPYAPKTTVAAAPVLSFPGVAEVGSSYGAGRATNLTFGQPSVVAKPASGGLMTGFSNLMNSVFSLGTPVSGGSSVYDDAIMRAGRASGQTTYNPNIPGSGMIGPSPSGYSATPYAPTTVVTAPVDGQTGWIGGMKDALAGIMGMIGATGDGQAQVTPVAVQEPTGPNWALIAGVVLAAGAVYYVATRK